MVDESWRKHELLPAPYVKCHCSLLRILSWCSAFFGYVALRPLGVFDKLKVVFQPQVDPRVLS